MSQTPPASRYIHGTEPHEQQRLSTLNDLINDSSLQVLRLRGGERILDLGCGLAQFTRAMARVAGTRVVGIERSREQIAEGMRQASEAGEERLLDLRQGDVLALELGEDEWGGFDLAHARFVLEHVADPLAVVRAMVRAVKPGGRIVLEDDDHDVLRLWPEPPGFRELWGAYARSYDRLGNDPYVGRRLATLIHQAGGQPRRNHWLFFGACSGDPHLGPLVENMATLLEEARQPIVVGGMVEAKAFDAALATLRAWGDRPDVGIWFARCWAEGVRGGR